MNTDRQDECADFQRVRSRLSRRAMLQYGGVSLASPWLPAMVARSARAAAGPRRIKSCLFWFQVGGVSQPDTFDMKPDLAENFRGEFAPIETNVPGMLVCEHLPQVAQHMDKLCVVRSMHHRMLCHNPGIYAALSGREVGESKAVSVKTFASREDYPHLGCALSTHLQVPPGMPKHVSFPFYLRNGATPSPGQHAGFLGHKYDPLLIVRDPAEEKFRVEELLLQEQVSQQRFVQRQTLLQQLDHDLRRLDNDANGLGAVDEYYTSAATLLGTSAVQQAFHLQAEEREVRDRYGRHTVGQSALLGRRLIEAGVPFVSVYAPVGQVDGPSWDTHQQNFPRLKNQLLPPVDQALSALLDDMHQRGLLEETLVIFSTEFGRTPQIGVIRSNNSGNQTGRDHWPGCYTILLAGARVRGGTYFGQSDRLGWDPKEKPIHIGDFAATLYDAFGLDPAGMVCDSQGRPHQLADGLPVPDLLEA